MKHNKKLSQISTIRSLRSLIIEISDLIFFSKHFEPKLTIYNPSINVISHLESFISHLFSPNKVRNTHLLGLNFPAFYREFVLRGDVKVQESPKRKRDEPKAKWIEN